MVLQFLLRFARKIVDSVMNEILGEVTKVNTILESTVDGFLQEILSGAWEGDDAEAFVAEVREVVANQGFPMRDQVRDMTNLLQTANDLIDQADSKVMGVANELGDIFKAIF